MGGNDFIPKFHGYSHDKWMRAILETPQLLCKLVSFESTKPSIDMQTYMDCIKRLYCPRGFLPGRFSLEEVRQLSIKPPEKDVKHPTAWMPPVTALNVMYQVVNLQLKYMTLAGHHEAKLPNFQEPGCLKKDSDGVIGYNFGPDIKTTSPLMLITINESDLKVTMDRAKRRERKRARSCPATPKRRAKRKPMMSTPK